ncbi:MAG: S-layer homology domain-containing protein [Cyanobacteria bacterium P01_D01_bin.2]
MSQIPSDPGTDRNRRRALTYDELIAMFVAFTTLGSVLFWGLTRSGVNLFGSAGLFSAEGAPALVGEAADSLLGAAESDELALDDTAENDFASGIRTAQTPRNRNTDGMISGFGESVERATETTEALPPSTGAVRSQAATTPQPATAEPPPPQAAQPASPGAPATPSTAPLETVREPVEFRDVPDDYWAKPYIDALSERLVIDGLADGSFAPDQPVTRGQLASAIAQAFPLEGPAEDAIAFSDVAADYWATDAIGKSVEGGFMRGFPDDSFQPALQVPRAQVLTALVTGLDTAAPNDVAAILERYSDAAQIPDWATGKMAAATQSNIVINYPELNLLNPTRPATRAEVAAMIYQTLTVQGRVEPIEGAYVVDPVVEP